MTSPEERARDVLRPEGHVGGRLRRHVAPPLIEDLEQAIAQAIREALRAAEAARKGA